MMALPQRWCRVTVVGPDGTALACCLLEGAGAPDLGTVDEVARLALLATRLGGCVTLSDVAPAMQELLELAALPVEVKRQAELRKEPLGIQEVEEEVHPGDLPA